VCTLSSTKKRRMISHVVDVMHVIPSRLYMIGELDDDGMYLNTHTRTVKNDACMLFHRGVW
jgi:hypothetical protein